MLKVLQMLAWLLVRCATSP